MTRDAVARVLTALAALLPRPAAVSLRGAAVQHVAEAEGSRIELLDRKDVAIGFKGRLSDDIFRRLQEIDECTKDTSVGDAEAGIAIYEDEAACDREGPLVGCNGEIGLLLGCRFSEIVKRVVVFF